MGKLTRRALGAVTAAATMTLPDPPSSSSPRPTRASSTTVEPAPRPRQYPDAITRAIAQAKATRWVAAEAESLPPVRKALQVITGTISTLALGAYRGTTKLPPSAHPWLAQPDPARTSQALIAATIRDGIWWDRSVWRPVAGGYRRISPERVALIPPESGDPDDPPRVFVDGSQRRELVVFDFAGSGGLRRFGAPLLDMYVGLMEAATRYADEPVPSIILKNTGTDVPNDQIDAILDRWETARAQRRTGFLNAYLDAITPGYSARDLQLVEVMDQLTKDVARLFGLPPYTLGVDAGSSMTYSNIVEQRRDLLEALRPWSSTIEQTLSLDEYAVFVSADGVTATRRGMFVPYGTTVRFDTTDYLREGFSTRITALTQAIAPTSSGEQLMTLDEARALEPTIPNEVQP